MVKTSQEAELSATIAEQQKRIRELEESERLFRATFEQTSVGKAHVSLDGRWLRVNQRLCEITGYTREELLATSFQAITHPEDLNIDIEHASAVAAGKLQRYSLEKRYFHKDGHIVWVYLTVSALRDEHGRPSHFISVIEDISARKQVEEQLKLERERFQFATEAAQIGYWFCNLPFDKLVWDTYTKSHFWLPPDAEVDLNLFYARLHPDDRERTRIAIDRSIREHVGYEIEYRTVNPETGQIKWIRALGRTKYSESNVPIRFDGITLDVTRQVNAKQSLAESEERLRLFIENAPAGIAMFDREMRYAAASRRWRQDYGIAEDFIGRCHYDLFPDIPQRWREAHQRALAGERVFAERDRFDRADGTSQWLKWEIYPWHTATGEIAGIMIAAEDITEVVRAEEKLRDSERQILNFANSIPTLAWMANADGWIFWYNKRWYDYTGTTPEQMEGWGWQSVHDPAMLPKVMEQWNSVIRTGEPFEMIFPLRGADGVFRSFLTRVVPARDSAGKIVRWFGTNTDVDELRRTREQLAMTEERMRIGLKNLPLVLYTTDRELRYTWVYSGIPDLIASDMVGRKIEDLVPAVLSEQSVAQVDDLRRTVLETGVAARRELRILRNGSERVIDVSAEPLRDAEGNVSGLTVAALEITDRVRSEEALRKQEKLALVGRISATISHEINNPLAAIFNLLFMCQLAESLPAALDLVKRAEEELKRVSQIVNNTLMFNRESGSLEPEMISALVDSAVSIFSGRVKRSQVKVQHVHTDRNPVPCLGSELRQVFANLIGNALEATAPGGRLLLRTREIADPVTGERGVRVTVADTGSGMARESLRHIYEPFFTTKGIHGTGLGLWVSKGIVEKHMGKIRFRSRKGCGTVFTVWVPSALTQKP